MWKIAEACLLCIGIICVCSARPCPTQEQTRNPSCFACSSSYFTLDDFEKQRVVDSPDGQKRVQLTKSGKFRVLIGDVVTAEITMPEISCNIEVGWSPDSEQFFISYSDGGAAGGYYVHMYIVKGNTLSESNVPSMVMQRFKSKHWCATRGDNLYFLAWTPDSKIAFLVAEVYPTSDCGKEMGTLRGYAADTASAKVLRVFGQKQTDAIEKECRASGRLELKSSR